MVPGVAYPGERASERAMRMANDQVRDASKHLVKLAEAIANAAPDRPGKYVYKAGIPWPLIIELRQTLKALGIERKP